MSDKQSQSEESKDTCSCCNSCREMIRILVERELRNAAEIEILKKRLAHTTE
jgi:hypothetical protein